MSRHNEVAITAALYRRNPAASPLDRIEWQPLLPLGYRYHRKGQYWRRHVGSMKRLSSVEVAGLTGVPLEHILFWVLAADAQWDEVRDDLEKNLEV